MNELARPSSCNAGEALSEPTLSLEQILDLCQARKAHMSSLVDVIDWDVRGILFSEMLLFCAVAEHLGVQNIVESGRARGNSAEIIARWFEGRSSPSIHSIEMEKYSHDNLIAISRLRKHRRVHLHHGDARYLLPALIGPRLGASAVLIDGPKGRWALQIAARVLTLPAVKAVFLHDFHRDSEERTIGEEIFPNLLASDDPRFVSAFRDLDAICWSKSNNWMGCEPYRRSDRPMRSYGPTLAMILNHPEAIDRERLVAERFDLPPMPARGDPLRTALHRLRHAVPRRIVHWRMFLSYYAKLWGRV